LGAVVVVLALCSCTVPSGGTKRATAPPATASVVAAAAPTPNQKMIDEVTKALLRAELTAAAEIIDHARQLSPLSSRPSAQLIAYFDATVHSYQGDYRGAANVMYEHVAKVGPTGAGAFDFHDAMIALRTADGDLLGALVECEEMVKAGTLGTWSPPEGDRMTLVRLKEHWHRAYLLRMIAQTLGGAERGAFIAYAESARQQYTALAAPLGGLGDSIAVLDAYFAFCDGVRSRMLEATKRVNIAQDDDIEDLYLVQLALDGAGDTEAAAAVRRRMSAQTSATVLVPVFLAWMRADEAAADGRPPQFSPKYPAGSRPN
jgi:hypothetical protein